MIKIMNITSSIKNNKKKTFSLNNFHSYSFLHSKYLQFACIICVSSVSIVQFYNFYVPILKILWTLLETSVANLKTSRSSAGIVSE